MSDCELIHLEVAPGAAQRMPIKEPVTGTAMGFGSADRRLREEQKVSRATLCRFAHTYRRGAWRVMRGSRIPTLMS